MSFSWIWHESARADVALQPAFAAYDRLCAAIAEDSPDLEQLIAEAPLDTFRINGSAKNLSLIRRVIEAKHLSEDRQVMIARAMLSHARFIIYSDDNAPRDHAEGESGAPPLIQAALDRSDGLAMALAQAGVPVESADLLHAMDLNRAEFLAHAFPEYPESASLNVIYHKAPPAYRPLVRQKIDAFYRGKQPSVDALRRTVLFSNGRDMLEDFTRRVLVPAVTQLDRPNCEPIHLPTPSDALQRNLLNAFTDYLIEQKLKEGKTVGQILEYFEKLARSWAHPSVRFTPRDMTTPPNLGLPEHFDYEWYPLTEGQFHASNGLVIQEITDSAGLRRISEQHRNCLHSFSDICCHVSPATRSHVFSVSTPDGRILSTFDLKQVDLARGQKVPENAILFERYKMLALHQHEERKIAGVARKVTDGPQHEAVAEFFAAIRHGKFPVQTSKRGETNASRERNAQYPALVRSCGYYPSRENIDKAFDQFKLDMRRGAAAIDDDERLVYDDITTDDGYTHRTHLIDGTYREGASPLSYRDMSIQEWLHATGFLNQQWVEAAQNNPKHVQAVSATEPPPGKKPPSHAEALRQQARFESGTLNKKERRDLSKAEEKAYVARLRDSETEKPYLARST